MSPALRMSGAPDLGVIPSGLMPPVPVPAAGPPAENVLLSGRLDKTDLFEICQFLLLGRKTGVLEIEHGERRGAFWFDDGQIVNAVDDALGEGEAAAYRVFSWGGGRFTFHLEPAPAMRSIHEGTESLLLEIARFMDEHREACKQLGEGPENDRPEQWTHEEGFRRRQLAGDELRQVFATLRESRGEPGGGNPLVRLWELARKQGHEAVLVRPGETALG